MLFKEGSYIISNDNRSSIALKEESTSYTLKNKNRIQVIHYALDNGIIPENDNSICKCDRIIECVNENNENIVYAVELKGKDVNHALEQLSSTIRLLFEPDYRERSKHFMKACNNTDISELKGKMVRLRAVSANPGKAIINGKKRSATHGIKYTKEAKLKQVCLKYRIIFDIDSIVIKSGSSECIG